MSWVKSGLPPDRHAFRLREVEPAREESAERELTRLGEPRAGIGQR